jgi:hypothetical protein
MLKIGKEDGVEFFTFRDWTDSHAGFGKDAKPAF